MVHDGEAGTHEAHESPGDKAWSLWRDRNKKFVVHGGLGLVLGGQGRGGEGREELGVNIGL
jgi:hypothetical protein